MTATDKTGGLVVLAMISELRTAPFPQAPFNIANDLIDTYIFSVKQYPGACMVMLFMRLPGYFCRLSFSPT